MCQNNYEPVAKAVSNPNPTNTPELKRICEQLKQVRKQITEDINSAVLDDNWEEILRLLSLDKRALEVMQRIGCQPVVTALDRLIDDNFVFTK